MRGLREPMWLGLMALVLVAGCSREQEELTRTELMRLTLDPKVTTFLLEAEQAYKRGAYVYALALADSAGARAPLLADVHFLRGRIYTDLNRLEAAREAYENVLQLDPAYRGARLNMGINLVRRGDLREALRLYREEEALAPSAGLYLEMGRAYAKLAEADSARTAYEHAVAMDSTNTTALMWLGQLHEEIGDLDKALAYSRRGLQARPDNLDYRYIVGSQLFRLGRAEEAVQQLEPVARERPWHHGAQYNLGQALMRLGREAEAQEYLARADRAQQLTQEVNDAEEAIKRDPQNLETWMRLSRALRAAGQFERNVEALKVAVTLQPLNLGLQTNLATAMLEAGDGEGAIRRYRTILSLDSTLADVWLNLGVAFANLDRHDEARAAWNEALRHRPGDETVTTYLARLDEMDPHP